MARLEGLVKEGSKAPDFPVPESIRLMARNLSSPLLLQMGQLDEG